MNVSFKYFSAKFAKQIDFMHYGGKIKSKSNIILFLKAIEIQRLKIQKSKIGFG